MEKRELTCIGCPMGCALTVELDGGAVVSVRGNTCPRGDAYARKDVSSAQQPDLRSVQEELSPIALLIPALLSEVRHLHLLPCLK